MSNALATLTTQGELSDIELMILEESQEDDNAFDVIAPRLKMPSGGAMFFDLNGEPIKELTGIVIISQKSRAYWPDSETMGKPPLCSSPDGMRGVFNSDDSEQLRAADEVMIKHPAIGPNPTEASYECRACPLSKFGSATKGNGQACKDLRRLVILADGYGMPILATLPPTSIKSFDAFATAQKAKRSAFFACRARIALEKRTNGAGIDYAVVTFEHVEDVSESEMLLGISAVRKEYRSIIENLDIVADEYATIDDETPF